MREKLIELIRKARAKKQYDFLFGDIDTAIDLPDDDEYIADQLIANGVTVQEWISVKDRLPEIYTQVLCFTGSSVQLAMYEGNDKWFTNYHTYTLEGKNLFTHWMYLPNRRKENDYG